MLKITMLGAGSAFTPTLCKDIMLIDGIEGGEFALVDIDPKRLDLIQKVVKKTVGLAGKRWTVTPTTDRRKVLKGTNFLVNTIEVSGVATVKFDHQIPMKYGVKQCIGDTIGPGGLFKALRTIPSWIEILRDAERYCPDALVLNYTNPMSMMTLAGNRASSMALVGLCHSVQGTSHLLAKYADVPYDEMKWTCGGINHMAWFTELSHKGKSLYPVLRKKMSCKEIYERDIARLEMMREFGYFVTESSGHFSEYVPYFRKRDDLIRKYCRPGYSGGTGFYATSWPGWRKKADLQRRRQLEGKEEIPLTRSHEYASIIIEAVTKNQPAVIYGSVPNEGLIDNLPSTGVVEVACMVDRNGFHPCRFGPLPPQCAALCASNMHMFELGVQAALERDRESAVRALQLDPLTAAVCSLAEIRKMTEELFRAEKKYLPGF